MNPEIDTLYAQHAAFVRRILARYGVRESDLDDAVQEVFVVAHRQLPTFEGRAKLETWLHAICFKTAAGVRRRAHRRHERPEGENEAEPGGVTAPATRDVVELEHTLSSLDVMREEHRDLWALAEIGGLSVSELSRLTGLARATVRTRLKQAQRVLYRRTTAGTTKRPEQMRPSASSTLTSESGSTSPFVHIDPGCCICTLGGTVIGVWRHGPTPLQLARVHRAMLDLLERHPKIAYLCVIESSSTPPDRTCRQINERIMRSMGSRVEAAAFAVEGARLFGLAAALMNSYFFLARSPIRVRYFRSLADAAQWMSAFGTHRADTRSLSDHVAWMKRQLDKTGHDQPPS